MCGIAGSAWATACHDLSVQQNFHFHVHLVAARALRCCNALACVAMLEGGVAPCAFDAYIPSHTTTKRTDVCEHKSFACTASTHTLKHKTKFLH